jgi:hypothetical protein
MAALSLAWETIKPLLDGRATQQRFGAGRPPPRSSTSGASNASRGENQSNAVDLDDPDECLDWVLGALIEGGRLQGDPLSSSEVKRALNPIAKETGRSSFDVWLAHRTMTMQAALDADRSDDDAANNWIQCYECLDKAQCDKVIMLMLDELLAVESEVP